MSPGSSTESYPAFARIGLRENPGKPLNQITCPDRDSNPGHLVSRPDALTVTPQSVLFIFTFLIQGASERTDGLQNIDTQRGEGIEFNIKEEITWTNTERVYTCKCGDRQVIYAAVPCAITAAGHCEKRFRVDDRFEFRILRIDGRTVTHFSGSTPFWRAILYMMCICAELCRVLGIRAGVCVVLVYSPNSVFYVENSSTLDSKLPIYNNFPLYPFFEGLKTLNETRHGRAANFTKDSEFNILAMVTNDTRHRLNLFFREFWNCDMIIVVLNGDHYRTSNNYKSSESTVFTE
ncbi:hypothetical protein ANN_04402 [Periplaneta americana]|uniref:Uncharacterized protein n=1 Tax=Periplaneta americana TaxID=6978 RepID=A0ABQ8T8G3_PERAM|nr:hypothetical protein ANN_04402 [Periplaneta americana]